MRSVCRKHQESRDCHGAKGVGNCSTGFTLTELMVVASLILLLTGVALVFGRQGEREIALVRSAERLAFDFERARSLALQTRSFSGAIPCGYGIFVSRRSVENTSYVLYADTPEGSSPCASGDIRRQSGAQDVDQVPLEPGVTITGFALPVDELHVVFAPPRPELKLFPAGSRAEIQLGLSGSASQRTVIIEASGEIRVE